ncbi:MAG: CopG family transcriptional regulator [Candidatus Limnocylindrales bacterium]
MSRAIGPGVLASGVAVGAGAVDWAGVVGMAVVGVVLEAGAAQATTKAATSSRATVRFIALIMRRRTASLVGRNEAMYTYIVERTQIYLTLAESSELDRLAASTGRTRSQLIREAIEAQYLARPDLAKATAALDASFGAWTGDERPDGAAYVEMVRPGNLARRLTAGDRRRAARPR